MRITQCDVNAENAIPPVCGFRNTPGMNVTDWINEGLSRPGKTQRGLARALGIDPSGVNRLVKGQRQLRADEVGKAARYFGDAVAPDDLFPKPTPAEAPATAPTAHAIQEIDVRAGCGLGGEALVNVGEDGEWSSDAVAGEWKLPAEYLAGELHVRPSIVKIIRVVGDSMSPTLSTDDRVMVNVADKVPSPGGVFALWDGLGVVVKRLEHIPNSDPIMLRISSDNPHHGSYERTLEEVNIIGRVIWFARRI